MMLPAKPKWMYNEQEVYYDQFSNTRKGLCLKVVSQRMCTGGEYVLFLSATWPLNSISITICS